MQNKKGYISIAVLLFLLFFAIAIYPRSFKPTPSAGSNCPIIGNAPSYGGDFIQQFPENTGNRQNMVDYILVRENVIIGGQELILRFSEHAEEWPNNLTKPITKPDGTTKLYRPLFATDWGEFGLKDEFSPGYNNFDAANDRGGGNRVYNMYKEGYVYALHLTDTGTPIILDFDPTNPDDGEPPYAHIVDLYQMKSIYDDPARTYDDNGKVWECPSGARYIKDAYKTAGPEYTSGGVISIPAQNPSSDKNQLQLEWFKFGGGGTFLQVHCKPAIYLYPKEKTLVNVKVNTKGFLTYVDPKYPEGGWNVIAYPDGKLIDNSSLLIGNSYPYLYYESKVPDQLIQKPEKGWIITSAIRHPELVSGSSTEWFGPLKDKFEDILPKLGLNKAQTKDFIDYWEKALPDSPYYFVGIADQESINNAEPLEITPKPDYVNRVRIFFEALNEPKNVESPDLGNWNLDLGNSTFKVVEWGGFIKRDKNHPFTCSQ